MGEKSAQRQFLVKIDGIRGWWAQKSGGAVTSAVTKVYDGGALVPDILTSPQDVEDITLTRPYDRLRDYDTVKRLRQNVGRRTYTVTVTNTDRDLRALKQKERYVGVITRVQAPDVDAGSSDAGTVQVTMAVNKVT